MALERSRYPPIDVSIRNKVSLIMKIPFDVGSIRGAAVQVGGRSVYGKQAEAKERNNSFG